MQVRKEVELRAYPIVFEYELFATSSNSFSIICVTCTAMAFASIIVSNFASPDKAN